MSDRDLFSRALSRRSFLRNSALASFSSLLAAYAAPAAARANGSPPPAGTGTTPGDAAAATDPGRPPLNQPMRPRLAPDPSLDVKIGQMLLVGFRGASIADDSLAAKNVRDQHVGGVVMFSGNIRSKAQLKALTTRLQELAEIPLLISLDQEGGRVSRLSPTYGFAPTLTAAQLGKDAGPDGNLDETRSQATLIAQELADCGFNLNLAPVVDLAVNPGNPVIARLERSYSADPALVARLAGAFIDSHHEQGVKCTLKHFPGHGSSTGDTHLGFVDVTATWSQDELIPYRELIAQNKVDAVMTAHIFNAKLDQELPATLSPAVVTGLLRDFLGYDGVVISDDMQMRAITDRFSIERAFELAIVAGVDMIAVANDISYSGVVADSFISTVKRMLDAGTIDEARIDQSYRRLMRLKGL